MPDFVITPKQVLGTTPRPPTRDDIRAILMACAGE
jgi:hypothetical protein